MNRRTSLRHLAALALGVLPLTSAACGDDGGSTRPVTVLTWNLYLGAELEKLATVSSPDAVPGVAAELWADVQASDYPGRAKVLAANIQALHPDLVALQEVTLYRRQTPSDFVAGAAPNATDVVIDFLATLLAELDAKGGGYRVAVEAPNADIELPVSDGAGGLFDLRVGDRDVILVRDGVTTANPVQKKFNAKLTFPLGGLGGVALPFVRSFSHVDVEVPAPAGATDPMPAKLTFGTSHLEIQPVAVVQMAQAQELVDAAKLLTGPVMFAGDYNSVPGANSYPTLMTAFKDLAAGLPAPATDGTCCQQPDLTNEISTAVQRIDLVLTRGSFKMKSARPVGSDPAKDRTATGRWASDHLGVYAEVGVGQ